MAPEPARRIRVPAPRHPVWSWTSQLTAPRSLSSVKTREIERLSERENILLSARHTNRCAANDFSLPLKITLSASILLSCYGTLNFSNCISPSFFFFFFFFFGCSAAYGVPGPGIRSELQFLIQPAAGSLTHCAGLGSNLRPTAPKTLLISLCHRGNSSPSIFNCNFFFNIWNS